MPEYPLMLVPCRRGRRSMCCSWNSTGAHGSFMLRHADLRGLRSECSGSQELVLLLMLMMTMLMLMMTTMKKMWMMVLLMMQVMLMLLLMTMTLLLLLLLLLQCQW